MKIWARSGSSRMLLHHRARRLNLASGLSVCRPLLSIVRLALAEHHDGEAEPRLPVHGDKMASLQFEATRVEPINLVVRPAGGLPDPLLEFAVILLRHAVVLAHKPMRVPSTQDELARAGVSSRGLRKSSGNETVTVTVSGSVNVSVPATERVAGEQQRM